MKKTVLKKVTIYFKDTIEYNSDEEFEQNIQLDIDNIQQGDTDYEFNYIAVEDVEEENFPFWLFN